MRAWWLVLIGACSFEPGVASQTLSDARARDGQPSSMPDGPAMIDAAIGSGMIDASPQCIALSTLQFGGHHYWQTVDFNWVEAQAACAAVGGHLAKIESMAENDQIRMAFAQSKYTWIGLSDPQNNDQYAWTDGSALTGYNAFAMSTPPQSQMNCVDSNGTWEAFDCTYANHGGTCECE